MVEVYSLRLSCLPPWSSRMETTAMSLRALLFRLNLSYVSPDEPDCVCWSVLELCRTDMAAGLDIMDSYSSDGVVLWDHLPVRDGVRCMNLISPLLPSPPLSLMFFYDHTNEWLRSLVRDGTFPSKSSVRLSLCWRTSLDTRTRVASSPRMPTARSRLS